jgi:HD-like signal output (HDOD) protein
MSSPEVLIQKCPDLASLPMVYHKLNEAINSPSCTTGILSRIVGNDPGLTMKILRMVNSAFYGFPNEIEDIPQAIVIIGMQQLNDLVLTHSIVNLFNGRRTAPFSLTDFWKFSLANGLSAKIISQSSSLRFSERVFVGGLLHNIGKLLMSSVEPDKYTQAIELSRLKNIPLTDAEKQIFGFTHTDTNYALMTSWKIPLPITDIASNYLNPSKSGQPKESLLLLLSHSLVQSFKIAPCGEHFLPALPQGILEDLCLTPGSLEEVRIPLKSQLSEVLNTFIN